MLILNKKNKIRLSLSIAATYSAIFFGFSQLPDDLFHIYFLDVGQGDSILIKTPENHQILIDGGPGNFVVKELAEVMPFFDKSLDMLVLTHPHADHLDGLVEVLKRYKVSNVLLTGIVYESPGYEEFMKEIEVQELNVIVAASEEDFYFGNVFFDVLYPSEQMIGMEMENVNNSSIVLKVSYKDKKILLVGDSEKEVEAELINSNLDLSADILKAGHHGSKTSSTPEFLNKVAAQIVVIQCGKDNQFGHPDVEALDNMQNAGIENILRNDIAGRVEFTF